jgi:large subunit ribosomal protein L21
MKAVISVNGRQYLVQKGDELTVSRLDVAGKNLKFEALAVFDETKITLGRPTVAGASVTAEVVENSKGPKTTAIRFKAKKRVKKIRGARQPQTKIKITTVRTGKTA